MLIPQFSLRWILAAMTVLAVVFLFVGQAVKGSSWAMGVSAAAVMLAAVAAIHATLFFLVWLYSVLFVRRPKHAPPSSTVPSASPFARLAATPPSSLPSQGNE